MNFVYPNFLWALTLLCIPIIIHLFNFRRYKVIYFSKVDLLTEAKEHSKSGNTLKHILILISRLLLITALVFAFSQPYIQDKEMVGTKTVTSLYIDNSFSMQAEGQDGNLLNEVKNKAIDLVKSFDENEKINLLTSELLAKDQRFYTKSEIIDRIKTIDLSPATTQLNNVINLQSDLFETQDFNTNKRQFIFSDFQKTTHQLNKIDLDETKTYFYQSIPEQKDNIYIDSVWFESPVQTVNIPSVLHFRIKNTSNKTIDNLNVKLELNGKERGFKSIKLEPNSTLDNELAYSHLDAGIKKGKLQILTNQLFFDDAFYFSYEIQSNCNILIINEPNSSTSFNDLFEVKPFYNASSILVSDLKQDDFKDKQLIIFNSINAISSGQEDLIRKAINNSLSVILIPGEKINITKWNDLLKSFELPYFNEMVKDTFNLNYFNFEDPLYQGVFEQRPKKYKSTTVNSAYKLKTHSSQRFITLFGSQKNIPFMVYNNSIGKGRLFLQATPLLKKYTDFSRQALFAATFFRIAETSAYQKKLFYTIDANGNYPLRIELDEKRPLHLISLENEVDIIPEISKLNNQLHVIFNQLNGQLKHADFYKLTDLNDFSDELAFNYSRIESDVLSFDLNEIIKNFKDIGWNGIELLNLNQNGKIEISNIKPQEYWRLFLFLALVFLGIETLLVRLWRPNRTKN